MYARIIDGRVAELTEDTPQLGARECAVIVEAGAEVQVGWVLERGELVPPKEPAPDPQESSNSYLLADANTVEDLRAAVATILNIPLE